MSIIEDSFHSTRTIPEGYYLRLGLSEGLATERFLNISKEKKQQPDSSLTERLNTWLLVNYKVN